MTHTQGGMCSTAPLLLRAPQPLQDVWRSMSSQVSTLESEMSAYRAVPPGEEMYNLLSAKKAGSRCAFQPDDHCVVWLETHQIHTQQNQQAGKHLLFFCLSPHEFKITGTHCRPRALFLLFSMSAGYSNLRPHICTASAVPTDWESNSSKPCSNLFRRHYVTCTDIMLMLCNE